MAEDIFKRLFILTNEIPDHLRDNFFKPLLPSVLLLARTFPPLCAEATKLFVGLTRTTSGGVSGGGETPLKGSMANNSLANAAQRSFEELISCAVVKV